MQAALLSARGVVRLAGDDAPKFLNGLVTAEVAALSAGSGRFTALLTPQGKIVVDFIVARAAPEDGGGLFLDCPRALAPTLVERLKFYRLRAKLEIEDMSDRLGVLALWGAIDERVARSAEQALCYADPRLAALGMRAILPPAHAEAVAAELGATLVPEEVYEAHRIACAVPRGGLDFIYGDTFPHEADMDQLAGIDFAKGCFVGQEVVSRMQHRGTARTRVVPVLYAGAAPAAGVAVMAGDRPLGMMGSAAAGRGLASVRLDRLGDALAAGAEITAGGVPLRIEKPAWGTFAFPGEAKAAE